MSVKQKKHRSKNNATKRLIMRRAIERPFETDSAYFLKLVVVAICGTLWLKFHEPLEWFGIGFNALPIGLLLGVVFVKFFEPHQSDRKIWYAVLLTVGIISYFVPAGIVI